MIQPMNETWCVVVEHPTYGEARVWLRWGRVGRDRYRAEPFALEFDFFTPPEEQDRMVAEVKEYSRSLYAEVHGIDIAWPATTPRPPQRP